MSRYSFRSSLVDHFAILRLSSVTGRSKSGRLSLASQRHFIRILAACSDTAPLESQSDSGTAVSTRTAWRHASIYDQKVSRTFRTHSAKSDTRYSIAVASADLGMMC